MHSKIFQVSLTPISADEYAKPERFYETASFADYIGDELTGEDRKERIRYQAEMLKDLFTLDTDGETLIYKGSDCLKAFEAEWVKSINEAAAFIRNGINDYYLYRLRELTTATHLRTFCRYAIMDWNDDYAEPLADLIYFIRLKGLQLGDRLYIGAVIDFHF